MRRCSLLSVGLLIWYVTCDSAVAQQVNQVDDTNGNSHGWKGFRCELTTSPTNEGTVLLTVYGIEKAEVVGSPEQSYTVKLTMTKKSREVVRLLSERHIGKYMRFLIGQDVIGVGVIKEAIDQRYLFVPGPFSFERASDLVKRIEEERMRVDLQGRR